MKTLNIGMVGYGFMGRTHSNAFRQVSHFFDVPYEPVLKTVCARNEARARAFAAKWGYESVATDWRKLVESPDIDVIDIVTPSHTHLELAWAALEAGKHVLCEKPVAYDYRETLRASAFAKAKSLKTKLGFTFRYSPGVLYAKSLIDEGFVGKPFIFNG